MKTQITTCQGEYNIQSPQGINRVVCPLRQSCKRFQQRKKTKHLNNAMLTMPYQNGVCEMFWFNLENKTIINL
jgi:hypothetical protein